MRITLIGFICISLTSIAGSLDSRSDSGIYGPKYDAILENMKTLSETYPSIASIHDYGKTIEGRTLRMLVLAKQNVLTTNRYAIQITGSIHGNEYLGIEDKLPGELLAQTRRQGPVTEFLNAGGVLLFAPIVNPDGYESRRRYNAAGADLNRDWDVPPAGHTAFKHPESRALAKALIDLKQKMNLKVGITVDYHCCAGALLYPWSFTTNPLPGPALNLHESLAKIAETELDVDYGTTAAILGYKPIGTTKDYYHALYESASFTYEGRRGKEDKYLKEHVNWWVSTLMNVVRKVM